MRLFNEFGLIPLFDYTVVESTRTLKTTYVLETEDVKSVPVAKSTPMFVPTIALAETAGFENVPTTSDVLVPTQRVAESVEDGITLNEKWYPVPAAIGNWEPLIVLEGDTFVPNFTAFPGNDEYPIVISHNNHEEKYTSVNGIRIGRNGHVGEWSRHSALQQMAHCDEILGRYGEDSPLFRTDSFSIRFMINSDYLYMTVERDSYSMMRIYQGNYGQFSDDLQKVECAFTLTRAILLTYAAVDKDSGSYARHNERMLATQILGIILRIEDLFNQ